MWDHNFKRQIEAKDQKSTMKICYLSSTYMWPLLELVSVTFPWITDSLSF